LLGVQKEEAVGILITILVLSLVIVVHEYGHYVAMRRNGIKVVEFTIGFGPTLWSRKLKSGTEFKLKPILIGGYAMPVKEGPESMDAATRWVKFKVAMAGMFFNSIAACLTLTVLTYITGKMPVVLHPLVGWAPAWAIPIIAGVLGSFGVWLATPPLIVWLIVTGFGNFVQGVAGPVGIIHMGSQIASHAATQSFGDLVIGYAFFFYMLNTAVAGCNLLPLHPLDGSFIPVLLLDKFGGKHRAWLVNAYRLATLALFVGLIALAFYSDFARLAAGRVLGAH
jgi:membrane-associated protease RseP (regulator of RpoE activity)